MIQRLATTEIVLCIFAAKKEKDGKSRKSPGKKLYFFFATFFAFFLAALANALTSELVIGLNLYLKFAKDLVSCRSTPKPKIIRVLAIKQTE